MNSKKRFEIVERIWNEKTRALSEFSKRSTEAALEGKHREAGVLGRMSDHAAEEVDALAQVLDVLRGIP